MERSSALPKTKQRTVMRICASCTRRLDRHNPRRATGSGSIKPIKKGKKPDTQLHRRLQRIEKLDPKAKRQITQLLDTFIEREELKQRVNAQGA